MLSTENSTFFLTWAPPVTLNVIGTEPNVSSYCVNVFNTTSTTTLHSECDINETRFSYPMPSRSWCDLFVISITPVNEVGNGTRSTVSYIANVAGKITKNFMTM